MLDGGGLLGVPASDISDSANDWSQAPIQLAANGCLPIFMSRAF
jgi:hypothetical protein